jgi:DNA-binding XRE family transcriptional regulator
MKVNQSAVMPPHLLEQCIQLGQRIARLRLARTVKQADAALGAGLSRNTAYRIEHGDPGLAMGQIKRVSVISLYSKHKCRFPFYYPVLFSFDRSNGHAGMSSQGNRMNVDGKTWRDFVGWISRIAA